MQRVSYRTEYMIARRSIRKTLQPWHRVTTRDCGNGPASDRMQPRLRVSPLAIAHSSIRRNRYFIESSAMFAITPGVPGTEISVVKCDNSRALACVSANSLLIPTSTPCNIPCNKRIASSPLRCAAPRRPRVGIIYRLAATIIVVAAGCCSRIFENRYVLCGCRRSIFPSGSANEPPLQPATREAQI